MSHLPDLATMTISSQEKLDLKRLARENEAEDYTDEIRRVKHSNKIAEDLLKIFTDLQNKKQMSKDEAQIACPFLFGTYPDIFQKAFANELNMVMMSRFLLVLKRVEDNEVDAHEGGLLIGKLLKAIYVDSALTRSAKSDETNKLENNIQANEISEKKRTQEKISWKEFKHVHLP